ncbi:Glucose-methanol-choline oxidoreductase [Metarhizium album ARSEF 1941]|uniref:Glucose-methanol-choline oxidoreductase n=1 Tax=Metarhizium album (strain ARSEF 1941) TaxID=1081103 RepID=A0A0B2X3Y5_METAS|nr:Glucose-methanol-choline oxidoreductase [Metarhizium album ARSEF 1941]KHO00468.1 Glucose-methanol-choline oxidoreductase [Metarhizium album ARSEF 1941]
MLESFLTHSYDYIVIGGGTAGLAVACRLAEDASLRVGVLEAGGIATGQDNVDVPAFYGRSLGGPLDWAFETEPQHGLGGRKLRWPRGKVLGGTSALNFMTWVRGSREDYDDWAALGNEGWAWDDLLPFFKKSETFHQPNQSLREEYTATHEPEALGTTGPIQISYSPDYSPSHKLWHSTLNALGIKTNSAHLAGSNVGVWTNVNTVDPTTATRSYSTSYCRARQPDNLHILTEATVHEILLSKDGAGDECGFVATGTRFSHGGKEYVVNAAKEVVLSAGTVQSPQILEMSGIGRPEVLKRAGVATKVDSPMVGENLQDHIMVAMIFEVDPSLPNPDDLLTDETIVPAAREQYIREQRGPFTILPCALAYVPFSRTVAPDVLAEMHAKSANVTAHDAQKRSILQKRLDGTSTLGQVEYLFDLGNWSTTFSGDAGKKYGTMLQMLQHPFSVGSIHTRPGSAGDAKPVIDPAYYAGPHGQLDAHVMRACIRFGQKIAQTQPLAGIIRAAANPTEDVVGDDARLRDWVRRHTMTDWHPVGTCGMGGRAGIKGGVVDERLKVHGVRGLRVVDASVMPLQISAHLQATVYAIAEKAAHMILQDGATRRGER